MAVGCCACCSAPVLLLNTLLLLWLSQAISAEWRDETTQENQHHVLLIYLALEEALAVRHCMLQHR